MAKKLDKVTVRSGRLIRVENTKRKTFSNAAKVYLAVWVEGANGKNERCLLFTPSELANAEYRSVRNHEDLTSKGLLADLID